MCRNKPPFRGVGGQESEVTKNLFIFVSDTVEKIEFVGR